MEEYETISIDNIDYKFTDIIYYDGVKLQIDFKNNNILSWYNEYNSYEDWFYIKSNKECIVDYLSNKVSLLDVILKGDIFVVKRDYNKYNSIPIGDRLISFDDYELPTNKSYIGFDYFKKITNIKLLNIYKGKGD